MLTGTKKGGYTILLCIVTAILLSFFITSVISSKNHVRFSQNIKKNHQDNDFIKNIRVIENIPLQKITEKNKQGKPAKNVNTLHNENQFSSSDSEGEHADMNFKLEAFIENNNESTMCKLLCEGFDDERNADKKNNKNKNKKESYNAKTPFQHNRVGKRNIRKSFKYHKNAKAEILKIKVRPRTHEIARFVDNDESNTKTESKANRYSVRRLRRETRGQNQQPPAPTSEWQEGDLKASEEFKVNHYVALVDTLRKKQVIEYKISPFSYSAEFGNKHIVMKFSPFKILSVDEREQSMTVSSFVNVRWKDDALRWPMEKHNNISIIALRTSEIWTPGILVPRANGDGFRLPKPEYAKIKTESRLNVRMTVLFKFTISCDLDMRLYPFDTQNCPVMFVEESDHPLRSLVTNDSEDAMTDYFGTSGEWQIQKKTLDDVENAATVFFTHSVQFTITLKRRSVFYIANLLVPLYITSFIALFVFWIPPETGEKVSFMVSLYVSTAMYLSIINDVLPRSLNELPSFNVIIVLVNCQIGLTFLVTLVVLRAYRRHLEEEKKNETKDKRFQDQVTTNGKINQRSGQQPQQTDNRYRPLTPEIFHIRKRTGRVEDIKMSSNLEGGKQTPSQRSSRSNSPVSHSRIGILEEPLTMPQETIGLVPLSDVNDEANNSRKRTSFKSTALRYWIYWSDYRRLDKIFFVIFTTGYVFSLFLPWVIHDL